MYYRNTASRIGEIDVNFLNYDSPFMQGVRRMYDYVVLGLLWAVVSLPVVTFGAAAVAALYTAEKAIEKHDGHMISTFFKCFRAEFKQASVLWLIAVLLIAVLIFDVQLLWNLGLPGGILFLSSAVLYVMFCWVHIWFGYLCKFTEKTAKLLYNTFCMVFQNFFLAILSGAATIIAVFFSAIFLLRMPPLLLIVPGSYLMAESGILRKITSRYITQ